jgi:hypothetical protein
MRFRAALFLFPVVAFAQTATPEPPPEVDAALRARVNEFFGYHVTGDFEQAWPMVANDTKKEYFSAQKTKYDSFKLDSIRYTDNFTKAVVTLTVTEKKKLSVQMPEVTMTHPTTTLWKIEDSKWCWYNDHTTNWLMPMGPSDTKSMEEAKKKGQAAPVMTAAQLQERVKGIMGQSAPEKTELKLASNKPSADQTVFRNRQGGQIKLALLPASVPKGMVAKLDRTELGVDEEAVLKVTYDPPQDAKLPNDLILSLVMEPFARVFPVMVRFAPAQ